MSGIPVTDFLRTLVAGASLASPFAFAATSETPGTWNYVIGKNDFGLFQGATLSLSFGSADIAATLAGPVLFLVLCRSKHEESIDFRCHASAANSIAGNDRGGGEKQVDTGTQSARDRR